MTDPTIASTPPDRQVLRVIIVRERVHGVDMFSASYCDPHATEELNRLGVRLHPETYIRQITVHVRTGKPGWHTTVTARPWQAHDHCDTCSPLPLETL